MNLATQITKNIFAFQLVGFGSNLVFDRTNRSLIIADAETGALLRILENKDDLDFDTFKTKAHKIYAECNQTTHN
jgi:hypothetical protein